MIVEIKDLIQANLVAAGISATAIARDAKRVSEVKTSGKDFYASIITATGGYEDPLRAECFVSTESGKKLVKVRLRRRVPVVVSIFGRSEEAVDPVFSSFIENLPAKFTVGLYKGDVEPDLEEHSDFSSAMTGRYESVVRITFSIDVGPSLSSIPLTINKIDVGED